MHARLAEVMDYLEKKREELHRSFAGVSQHPMRRHRQILRTLKAIRAGDASPSHR